MWINNTDGKPDAVLTMALLGFVVVIIKLLLAGFSFSAGGFSIGIGNIDAGPIAAVLGPTLGAYVGRKYTDTKFGVAPQGQPDSTVVPTQAGK